MGLSFAVTQSLRRTGTAGDDLDQMMSQ